MPTKRFENLDPRRRESILKAAQAEFARNGYEQASLNTIIRDAGISKGSLYYYFEDKTDLYLAVIENVIDELFREMEGIVAGEILDNLWCSIEKSMVRWMKIMREKPGLVRLWRNFLNLYMSPASPPKITEFIGIAKEKVNVIFKDAQKKGIIRTDLPFTLLVAIFYNMDTAFDLWIYEHIDSISDTEHRQLVKLYVDLLRKAFGESSAREVV